MRFARLRKRSALRTPYMAAFIAVVFHICAHAEPARAQPAAPDYDLQPPNLELPKFDRGLFDALPLPAPSPRDLKIRLRVIRSGMEDKKQGLFEARGKEYWRFDEVKNWSYGPFEMTSALYMDGPGARHSGQASILHGLSKWDDTRAHYLSILDSFAAARKTSGSPAPRKSYYAKIAPDVRRVLEAAKQATQDTLFLKSLIERQRVVWIGNQSIGPRDQDAPVVSTIKFAGGKATIRSRRTRVYFGQVDGETDQTYARKIEPGSYTVSPGPRDFVIPAQDGPVTLNVVPNIALQMMDMAGCEADQLGMIVAGLQKRYDALTPKPSNAFDLSDEERIWHTQTTRPALIQLLREVYRQGVYEAVRHSWAFSGQKMPRDMQLDRASMPAQLINWHAPYQSPDGREVWTDANGVPLVRDGADIRLPSGLDGRQIRIFVSETGSFTPTDISVLNAHAPFMTREIKTQLDGGVTHEMVTWQRSNSNDSRVDLAADAAGQDLGSFDIEKIEPAWTGYYTNSMQSFSAISGANLGNTHDSALFAPAPQSITPNETGTDFYRTPRMHALHAVNAKMPLKATLTLHYERDGSTPESYNVDLGSQKVTIEIEVASVSAQPPLQVCTEPVFDDPPDLRLVEFWENGPDDLEDDEYRAAETIWPGHPYFLEARFDEAPPKDTYHVRVDGQRRVRIKRLDEDAEVYLSDVITFTPRMGEP